MQPSPLEKLRALNEQVMNDRHGKPLHEAVPNLVEGIFKALIILGEETLKPSADDIDTLMGINSKLAAHAGAKLPEAPRRAGRPKGAKNK